MICQEIFRNKIFKTSDRRIQLCKTRNLLTKSSLLLLILVQIHTKASAIGCIFGFLHHLATHVAKMARDLPILIFHTPDGRHICF